MNRRLLLQLGAGALAGAGFAAQSAAASGISPGGGLSGGRQGLIGWDEFLAQARNTASAHFADRSQAGQDAYLYAIARHAARLGELPAAEPKDFGGLDPSYSLALIARAEGAPFIILYWRMEPGAVFPAHCHPVANVCTLCTAGEAKIRNFEIAPGAPPCWSDTETGFDVFETKREALRPGVVNMVTEFRNNIHWFEAGPDGAEGIDITTVYEKSPPFSFLTLTAKEETPGRFAGRWVGKDPVRALAESRM